MERKDVLEQFNIAFENEFKKMFKKLYLNEFKDLHFSSEEETLLYNKIGLMYGYKGVEVPKDLDQEFKEAFEYKEFYHEWEDSDFTDEYYE